jgi:hypothetical protein
MPENCHCWLPSVLLLVGWPNGRRPYLNELTWCCSACSNPAIGETLRLSHLAEIDSRQSRPFGWLQYLRTWQQLSTHRLLFHGIRMYFSATSGNRPFVVYCKAIIPDLPAVAPQQYFNFGTCLTGRFLLWLHSAHCYIRVCTWTKVPPKHVSDVSSGRDLPKP